MLSKDDGKLREVLNTVVCELVDRPDDCIVTQTNSEGGSNVIFTVRTADSDVGKVIGRQGKNAQALRTILEAMAAKYRLRVVLEIPDAREVGARKTKRSRNRE
jgi:predicted RNA-binding protein YlqC (UPF0109 family)